MQNFNRIQRSEWLDLFQKAGLELVEEECTYTDICDIKIDNKYKNLDRRDLDCTGLMVVHKRPAVIAFKGRARSLLN